MCKTDVPEARSDEPDVQTFETVDAFLDAIRPGMDLCTSDLTGWAEVQSVITPGGGEPGKVVGRVHADGRLVHVPADVLIEIRGGHCVRFDRVRATVDKQGWEVPAAATA